MAWLAPLHNWSHRRWGKLVSFLIPSLVMPHSKKFWIPDIIMQWICCSFFYWNRKGTVLNTKKICLEKENSLSIIPRDMPLIQGRETGPGTNHGSPRPLNNECCAAFRRWCLGRLFFFPPEKLLCIQFMRWKTGFTF